MGFSIYNIIVFDKKILKVFPFGFHGNKNIEWNGNIRKTFERRDVI